MRYLNSRNLHVWASIALALPILIVSLTAIFIAHDDALGTKKIEVGAYWLPGYAVSGAYLPEIRTVHAASDGRTYVGLKGGLFRLDADRLVREDALGYTEVRALAETSRGLMAATKSGVWLREDGRWSRVLDGEAWSLGKARGGELITALKQRGAMQSHDGGASWRPAEGVMLAVAGLPAAETREALTLQKLILDLHTGQAFLGKSAEWIWIDLIGLAMACLTVTGVLMWWRSRRHELRVANSAALKLPASPAPGTRTT